MRTAVRWTKEEDEFLKANYPQMLHKEIGRILNRTNTSISMRCTLFGLTKMRKVEIFQVFGKLTVIGISPKRDVAGSKYFLCNCSCGTKNLEIRGYHLTRGTTKSCGCLLKDLGVKRE